MYNSEWSDDLDDDEYPDEWESDDDDVVDLVECPHCRAEIYEEAQQCPVCEQYVSDARTTRLSPFWTATAVIVLVWIAYYLVRNFVAPF